MNPRKATALGTTLLIAATCLAGTVGSGSATANPTPAAQRYAPVTRPGPALRVPRHKLHASLHCSGHLRRGGEPVLLSPGTGVTPVQNFSWNYELAFKSQHRAFCTVTMPHHTLGNIETAGEYLVHAIRRMQAKAHRRIAILGHSQGGMSMRWALRFWPGTRRMVKDVIGMAPDNHGTTVLQQCIVKATKCPPADWQQGAKANFIKALNSRQESFAHISYTEIFSHTDEVVQPSAPDAKASANLTTGLGKVTSIATQDICPTDVDEHLLIGTIDPVAYALVMDALTHHGPAKPSRISKSVCNETYQPGVDPTDVKHNLKVLAAAPGLGAVAVPSANLAGVKEVSKEPRLRCYVFAHGCGKQAAHQRR